MSLRYTQPKDPPRSQHASSLLKKSSQPASPSVVSPASGRELKEGSQLLLTVLRPMHQQLPLAPLSQHPARGLCSEAIGVKKSLWRTLGELVGRESAERIIAEFGGARIWVPVRSTPDAKLTQILGHSAAFALCARFGGDYLQIPNTMSEDNVYRRIAELHRQGCKINEIALAVGRSRRTIFRLLRRKITDLHRPRRLAADW